MTNQERMSLLTELYTAIFHTKANNIDALSMVVKNKYVVPLAVAVGRWFSKGLLRGFDFDVQLGDKVLQLRMVEQNFTKTDAAGNLTYYANLAATGHMIVWVIDRKKKDNAVLGRIQDGQWHAAKPRATQPATNASQSRPLSEVPDIPNGIGIPDYVISHVPDSNDQEEDPYALSEYA